MKMSFAVKKVSGRTFKALFKLSLLGILVSVNYAIFPLLDKAFKTKFNPDECLNYYLCRLCVIFIVLSSMLILGLKYEANGSNSSKKSSSLSEEQRC